MRKSGQDVFKLLKEAKAHNYFPGGSYGGNYSYPCSSRGWPSDPGWPREPVWPGDKSSTSPNQMVTLGLSEVYYASANAQGNPCVKNHGCSNSIVRAIWKNRDGSNRRASLHYVGFCSH